ncbi:MAG: polyribonucleotide nucleotidyltransferase [Thermogemmatispora sp.]|jgi:polyribonucleotide nucleotidyltransferase|uniref:Polyribonucleotide nucleotidyltransferase n=1 Tax=Thermogemmatispora aurantia TaxID=2045279 RepID=A0A5J4K5Q4_9CHLR|nr:MULTISPECIES: polyribonucleotide nucleotidyltransferase [Thermogemmatispora]MBE3567723.1 polyribonucleotide nucleotidyltransferase [Thermogemmatispora sp.]GER82833.1 polyribonucleotide nucleotidyltransferase [Thermogemmatispora aurantia]
MIHRQEAVIGGRVMSIETGRVAEQANGAVLLRYGDTVILATAVASEEPREGIDFFPLTVDVEERMYAAGKIPGGFIKREGRASEHAILACRLADRPLRPLFPKGYRNDVQIIITVLSVDQENDPDVLGIIGASAALCISDIPFAGPVGAVRVGYIDNELVINPLESQMDRSRLDLVVAGTADAVMMVEAGAKELPEDIMLEAVIRGQEALQDIIKMQEKLMQAVNVAKRPFETPPVDEELQRQVAEFVQPRLEQAVNHPDKTARSAALTVVQNELVQTLGAQYPDRLKEIMAFYEKELKTYVRNQILDYGIRPDGRDLKTIRPITCEVGLLPRTHGSALFTRGQTQVLSVVTLGSPGEEQILDGLTPSESKRFMHHYNFPPFSTGETRPLRGPGRREIGHGALAERALLAVIPSQEEFPYTIRAVSDVLSSNGSTSMGSVCGTTLALMDAGVPIHAPVAGVAMGLVTGEGERAGKWAVLSDIQGIEDALGDMDFKVAGTADGVTALQMDIKVKGISYDIMAKALEQAREGRMYIMEKMLDALDAPRPELSVFAPRIQTMKINPDKIGAVIGPGGKTVRKIQDETGAKIDIEDDGTVNIAATSSEAMQQAMDAIRALTEEVEVGRIYTGTVRRLVDFGAFVEILPGKEGLVRTSQLADYQVSRPEDVVSVGDEITVMVIEVDSQGRINLSRRAALSGELPSQAELDSDRAASRGGRDRGGSGRGGGYGGGRDRDLAAPGRNVGYGGGGRDRGGYSERGGGGRSPGYNSGNFSGGQRRPMGPGGSGGSGRGSGGPRRDSGFGPRPNERRW